jgi:hypothetical protein
MIRKALIDGITGAFGVAAVLALFPTKAVTGPARRATGHVRDALLNAWLGVGYWIASRRRWRR